MQRARHILQQEADRQQVEKDAKRTADAVVAFAPLTMHVLDRYFTDRRAVPAGERRNKTVHLAVKRNGVDDLAPVGFERGAEVVNVNA